MSKKTQLSIAQFNVVKDRDKASYFKISKADENDFWTTQDEIQEYIKKKKPIPFKLHKKLLDFFIPLESDVDSAYTTDFISRVARVRGRFLSDKKYEFTYTNKKTNQEYSLSEMIDVCVHQALEHHLVEQPDKKDFCIKTSYQAMQNYISSLPVKYQKFMSHYKLSAISGFVAIVFGHELNKDISEIIRNGELPTNSEIFHSVDNITKKLKIKKRK